MGRWREIIYSSYTIEWLVLEGTSKITQFQPPKSRCRLLPLFFSPWVKLGAARGRLCPFLFIIPHLFGWLRASLTAHPTSLGCLRGCARPQGLWGGVGGAEAVANC